MKRYYLELMQYILINMKANNPIDENFFNGLINLILSYKDLNGFYKGLAIENKYKNEEEAMAVYNILTNIITFYMPSFLDLISILQKNLRLRPKEIISMPYLISSQTILHELEHASQKKTEGTNQDIESMILLATSRNENNDALIRKFKERNMNQKEIEAYFKIRDDIYKRYYKFAPRERLAENYSLNEILRILELLKEHWPTIQHLQSYFLYQKYNNLLKGYSSTLTPTKFYLESINAEEEWQEIEILSHGNLDLHDRLKLGLEITEKEYNEILNRQLQIGRKILK